jgi:hypothetical protein
MNTAYEELHTFFQKHEKDSRYERRDHVDLDLWDKYDTEESLRRNETYNHTKFSLNTKTKAGKGEARSATDGNSQTGSLRDLKRVYQETEEESNEMDIQVTDLEPDTADFKKMRTQIDSKRRRM